MNQILSKNKKKTNRYPLISSQISMLDRTRERRRSVVVPSGGSNQLINYYRTILDLTKQVPNDKSLSDSTWFFLVTCCRYLKKQLVHANACVDKNKRFLWIWIFKMFYLPNYSLDWWSDFTADFLASRFSKLNPMLIYLNNFFFNSNYQIVVTYLSD